MTSGTRNTTASRRLRSDSPASIRTRPSTTLDTVVAMWRRALIGFAVAVVLPGCGGGGSGTALTKEEYASKADAICSKYNQQTKTLATPKNLSDLAKVADQTLPV